MTKEKLNRRAGHSARNSPAERLWTIILVDDGLASRSMMKWFMSYVVQAFAAAEDALREAHATRAIVPSLGLQ